MSRLPYAAAARRIREDLPEWRAIDSWTFAPAALGGRERRVVASAVVERTSLSSKRFEGIFAGWRQAGHISGTSRPLIYAEHRDGDVLLTLELFK